MSQRNVEIVRRTYEAFDRGDISAILEDVDPEIAIWARPRGEEGKYDGHEGLRAFITEWIEPFEDFDLTAEEFLDAGDRVVVQTLQRARGKESGVPVEGQFWLVHHMRDGKVIELDLYDDKAEALAAAELSE